MPAIKQIADKYYRNFLPAVKRVLNSFPFLVIRKFARVDPGLAAVLALARSASITTRVLIMSITSLPPQAPMPMPSNSFQAGSNDPSQKKQPERLPRDSLEPPKQLQDEASDSASTAEAAATSQPSPDVIAKWNRIVQLLSTDSLIQMLRNPYAKDTAQSLKELRALLSEESLKTLTSVPAEMSQLRNSIGQVLSEKNIKAGQAEAARVPNPNLTPERIQERTRNVDPEESRMAIKQIEIERQQEKTNELQRTRLSAPLSKNLIAIGKPFQPAEADTTPESTPAEPDSNPLAKSKPLQSEGTKKPSNIDECQADSNTGASAEATAKKDRLEHLLSRASLIQMLRDPNSKETAQRAQELRELLSEDSLKTLAPDPAEREKIQNIIRQIFSPANLEALQREAEATPKPEQPLEEAHKDEPKLAPETDSAPDLTPNEAGNTPLPPAEGTPQTFSYNDINAAPGAVMNFTSGTDKIDLTGIRTQLGQKPLSLVERFSGVSGEMTINYYAGSNTSFVTISRNPGEPPFELKVSGEVRYRDLTA
ncbi:M10 family metallopeptidase C-terminal domain-containing protein [Pseudomonas sp. M5A4_2d]